MTFTVVTLISINFIILILGIFGNLLPKYYKQYVFFQVFLFAFFMGIRSPEVGVDTKAYIQEFLTGGGGYFKEVLYKYFGYVLYTINADSIVFILAVSLLMGFLAYHIIIHAPVKKEYKSIIAWLFLSNLMVVFNWTNGLRQGIAALLFLLCIVLYTRGKYNKSFLCLILAPFFHISALVFLPIFFFYYASRKMSVFSIFTSNKVYVDAAAVIIFLCFSYIIFSRIPQIVNKYGWGSKIIEVKVIIAFLFYFIINYFLLYHAVHNRTSLILSSYFYILCVSASFLINPEISNRFLYYSGCFEAVLIGIVLTNAKKNRFIYLSMAVLGNILYYIFTISTSQYAFNFNYN